MKNIVIFILITYSSIIFAGAQNPKTQCNIATCDAGRKVISFASKDDAYFSCPTNELSEYTNHVLGLSLMIYQFTGTIPNISPVTGDPEQQGQSKIILDKLRSNSKAKTFDEAVAACKKGKNKQIFMVANNPKDSSSMWVFNSKTKEQQWMPKSHLDLIK